MSSMNGARDQVVTLEEHNELRKALDETCSRLLLREQERDAAQAEAAAQWQQRHTQVYAKLNQSIALLTEILPWLEEQAECELYGSPCCDDPRDYTPDHSCCTDKEIAAWREACARAEAGESVEIPQHQWLKNEKTGTVCHVAYNPWGIGLSKLREPELCELRDKIRALLDGDKA